MSVLDRNAGASLEKGPVDVFGVAVLGSLLFFEASLTPGSYMILMIYTYIHMHIEYPKL